MFPSHIKHTCFLSCFLTILSFSEEVSQNHSRKCVQDFYLFIYLVFKSHQRFKIFFEASVLLYQKHFWEKKSPHTEIKVHILTYRNSFLKLLQIYLLCIHGFNYKVHWSLKFTLPLNNLKAVVLLWSDERIIGFATGPVNSPLSNHKCAHNSLSPALFLLGLSLSNSHTYKCTHAHKHKSLWSVETII